MLPGVNEATNAVIQQWGAFGAVFVLILVPLGVYSWRQTVKLNDVQEKRVSDAREVRDTLLNVTKEFSEALREQTRAAAETKASYDRVCAMMERVEEHVTKLEEIVREGNNLVRDRRKIS